MAAVIPAGKDKGASPELYLEVRKGETPVDPARWLSGVDAVRGGH
jgi:septal ring factor EnvC (AmiA/AmiB activator)